MSLLPVPAVTTDMRPPSNHMPRPGQEDKRPLTSVDPCGPRPLVEEAALKLVIEPVLEAAFYPWRSAASGQSEVRTTPSKCSCKRGKKTGISDWPRVVAEKALLGIAEAVVSRVDSLAAAQPQTSDDVYFPSAVARQRRSPMGSWGRELWIDAGRLSSGAGNPGARSRPHKRQAKRRAAGMPGLTGTSNRAPFSSLPGSAPCPGPVCLGLHRWSELGRHWTLGPVQVDNGVLRQRPLARGARLATPSGTD